LGACEDSLASAARVLGAGAGAGAGTGAGMIPVVYVRYGKLDDVAPAQVRLLGTFVKETT
jgi:hypothetical protein